MRASRIGARDGRRVAHRGSLAWSGSESGVETSWTLGAGVELALTGKVSFKAEYLHYDLGDVSYRLTPNAAASVGMDTVDIRSDVSGDIVRVGVNYRFASY